MNIDVFIKNSKKYQLNFKALGLFCHYCLLIAISIVKSTSLSIIIIIIIIIIQFF